MSIMVSSTTVVLLLILSSATLSWCEGMTNKGGLSMRFKRAEDTHDDEHEDEHDDEHGHDGDSAACAVTEHNLSHEFNELAEELSLKGPDGLLCAIEEDDHAHNESMTEESSLVNQTLTCGVVFSFVERLLVRLNLTTECCLENGTMCEETTDPGTSSSRRPTSAQAYGYGFLMILLVSACSLLGVLFLPLLKKNSKFGQFYKYFYSLMIALGASALFCDAVLHLIPEAFGLHDHSPSEEGHADDGHAEEEDQSFIWKGCVIIVGTYFFFLFETILHTWNQHSHGVDTVLNSQRTSENDDHVHVDVAQSSNGSTPNVERQQDTKNLISGGENGKEENNFCLEPTMPHGQCKDTQGGRAGILHPVDDSDTNKRPKSPPPTSKSWVKRFWHYISNIKPLAWLIIFGDAIHNFADGLALGAAISHSLSLGISTMIALVFHEIPHELGDFVILISTGMQWYIALVFNFVSALTAIVGFFVGVAISTQSEDANGWILAIAAGVFLYIALVDLLPELIHSKQKGWTRWGMFTMANIGLVLSFVALLLLAIYEERLNTLVTL